MKEDKKNDNKEDKSTIGSSELKQNSKKKKRIVLCLLLATLLVLVGGLFLKQNIKHKNIVAGNFPDATLAEKMTPDDLDKYAQKVIDDSAVTVNVYPRINVQSDGVTGSVWIQNLPTNTTGQQAVLTDEASGKKLFTSGMLNPGYEVREVTLSEKMSKGVHKGLITIEFYDLKAKKKIGQSSVDVIINVS